MPPTPDPAPDPAPAFAPPAHSLRALFIDMNSYFASCEQQLRPELRGRPIAVVPLEADTTSVIAASIQAKRAGVRTGTPVWEAKRLCPGIVLVKSRTREYVRLHHDFLAAIDSVIPVERVYSIDECVCRLQPSERDEPAARGVAQRIKRAMAQRVGECMTCSIGIAPNRLLAKVAADMHKPDGLTVLGPAGLPDVLRGLALRDLPGVGPRMELRLQQHGIATMPDLIARGERELGQAFGSIVGNEWWYVLRGYDVRPKPSVRRSLGHSHVLAPELRTREAARGVMVRLIAKAASRLRHEGYAAGELTISARIASDEPAPDAGFRPPGARGWRARTTTWKARAVLGLVSDTASMLRAFASLWDSLPEGAPMALSATLHGLVPAAEASPLFAQQARDQRLARAMDAVEKKFGANAIYAASMHGARTSAPSRIAFGSVPDLSVPDVVEETQATMLLEDDRPAPPAGG